MVELAFASFQSPTGGGSGWEFFPFLAAMIAIFYFLIIRPQQKQRKEREGILSAVKKGDRVVTTSGIHGTVVGLGEHTVTLKVADQVKVDFDRTAIGRIVPTGGDKESGS